MSELLSVAEGRLLDLLRAGAVPADDLAEAMKEFIARREAGQEEALGPYLVAEGLISVTTVQRLLGGGDSPEHTSERVAVELPALPDVPRAERPGASGRTPRGSRRAKRGSGRADRPARSTRARRSAEGDEGTGSRGTGSRGTGSRGTGSRGRASGKRRRATGATPVQAAAAPEADEHDIDARTARFDPKHLAAASLGESDRLRPIPAEDERTRAFDPDALAASSRKAPKRRPAILLPALMGGAVLVVGLGYAGLSEPDEIEPLPPPATAQSSPTAAQPRPSALLSPSETPTGQLEAEPAFAALAKEASALESREDYAGALAIYRKASPELRARLHAEIEAAERRLDGLARFKTAAESATAVLEGLEVGTPNVADRRQLEAAVAQAEALLEGAGPDLNQAPAARRLQESLEAVTAARGNQKLPGHDQRKEPLERQQRFEAGAREGARIVAAMRAGITQAKEKAGLRGRAAASRVRKRSRAAPLTLEVGGVKFKDAVVVRYDAQGFSLRSRGKEVAFDWSRIVAQDSQFALRVRRLAVGQKDALGQLDFGRWCLVNRLWDAAQEAFRGAVLLDARLKSRIPDVGRIARSSQVFRGKVQRTGNALELSYGFHLPAHNADWNLGGGARGGVDAERKLYVVRGRGMSLAALREVGWERTLLVRGVALLDPRARSLVGVTFHAGKGPEEVSYLVGIDPRAEEVLLLRRQNKKLTVVDRKPLEIRKQATLTIACSEGQLEARVDTKTLFRVGIPTDWGRTRVLVGGALEKDGVAAFRNVTISGHARRDWIRKAYGAFEDHLRAYMARTDELELYARPSGRRPIQKLSAEDEWGLAGVTESALAQDRRGRIKLALGKPLDLLAASNTFQRAVELSPSFAGARYRRGIALERLGRSDLALQELRKAANDCPHFYEARAAEARTLARDGDLEQALKVVTLALRERPDYPPSLSAKALVFFRRGELKETQRLLDLALALDPWDDEIRAFRRNVTNVRRGPPWERSFKEETVNYRVLTDISQARGRAYAEQLEVIREFYAEVFGVEGEVRAQRASVLIFDTEEGFQAYADLTTDDRVESLLGYYLPRYDQLLLYEGRDDATGEATRRVLYHEAFHQFIYPLIKDLPYWVNEGLADYFSATLIENGSVVAKGGLLEARLADLRRHVAARGRPLSPSGLIRETPGEFYSGPVAVKYAQAWSMVHFFLQGKQADYSSRFETYLTALRKGGNPTEAYQAAFTGLDWKAFEKAWWEYVREL